MLHLPQWRQPAHPFAMPEAVADMDIYLFTDLPVGAVIEQNVLDMAFVYYLLYVCLQKWAKKLEQFDYYALTQPKPLQNKKHAIRA